MYFDTHVHLNSPELYPQYKTLVERAFQQGVTHMVIVGYDEATSKRAIEIAEQYPTIYAAVGVHPTEVLKSPSIESLVHHHKVVAIGEIGLDYHWDNVPRETQHGFFRQQLQLAHRLKKPVIIHMRDAAEDTYRIMAEHPEWLHGGIMHCYSGSTDMVAKYLSLGLHISLGGPVTFTNAKTPKEVAQMVPSNRLLIETDSPYLAPHPFRGQRNEPAHVVLVAQTIAALRHVPIEELAALTTSNAKRLFNV